MKQKQLKKIYLSQDQREAFLLYLDDYQHRLVEEGKLSTALKIAPIIAKFKSLTQY